MSTKDRHILTLIDPVIKVDELAFEDNESDEAQEQKDQGAVGDSIKESTLRGDSLPYIQINSITLDQTEIESFTLKSDSFLPTVSVHIVDSHAKLTALDYPKDGDLLSLYIRPRVPTGQKEIRIDFDILSCRPSGGNPRNYKISGIMRIPDLFAEDCFSLDKESSFNHLMGVCEKLGLGFASNVDSTNDSMTRICPYDTHKKFIDDITSSSYSSDDSFFKSYIDIYYNLNFIDVNKQFSEEDDIEKAQLSTTLNYNSHPDIVDSVVDGGFTASLLLSNHYNVRGTDVFVNTHSLGNASGEVWITNGYKRYVQYYELDDDSYEEYFVDPLVTDGTVGNKILPKGRRNEEFYRTQIKRKWLGIQQTGNLENTHPHHKFAKILNHNNLEEITKMYLTIELDTYNMNLYRFQRIPIAIYEEEAPIKEAHKARDKETGDDKQPNDTNTEGPDYSSARSMVLNSFLTGHYIISGFQLTYIKGDKIRQRLKLLRREWPIPAISITHN